MTSNILIILLVIALFSVLLSNVIKNINVRSVNGRNYLILKKIKLNNFED